MEKTDNELIAEFMGFKHRIITGPFGGEYFQVRNGVKVECYDWQSAKWDTSWDWLMPVVEKIESLEVKFKIDGVRILVVSKQLQYYWNGGMVSEPKIICVYHGCVQFIKWYNSQAEYKR